MKKIIMTVLGLLIVVFFLVTGCFNTKEASTINNLSWDQIVAEGSNSTVTFYGWGGSQETNDWIDNTLTPTVKELYNITLSRVPMDIDEMINKLISDKQGNNGQGTMDIIWINGENFFTAKQSSVLYGPFTDQLPNVGKYLDPENIENNYDFGMKIDGYEAPYGRAQFVLIGDSGKVGEMPNSAEKLKEYVEKNKGVFTYPEVTDFTGSAFVRTIIYNTCDIETIKNLPADEDTVRKAIAPAISSLKAIAPNLWRKGKTYPTNLPQLDNMYADGEVNFTMNYAPFTATQKVAKGEWKETTETFVMEKGTVGNTNYLAIPFNSINKAGAALVINTILTPEMQGSKANPLGKGDIPVIEDAFLSAEEKQLFLFNNEGTISIKKLESKRLPEFSSEVVPIIEKIWREEVLGGK